MQIFQEKLWAAAAVHTFLFCHQACTLGHTISWTLLMTCFPIMMITNCKDNSTKQPPALHCNSIALENVIFVGLQWNKPLHFEDQKCACNCQGSQQIGLWKRQCRKCWRKDLRIGRQKPWMSKSPRTRSASDAFLIKKKTNQYSNEAINIAQQ